MQSRQKISTEVKFLASMNALPYQYHEKLHPSQLSRYKNYFNVQEYLGQELVIKSNDLLDTIRHFNQNSFDRKVMKGYLRLAVVMRKTLLKTKHFHKALLSSKDEIVEAVQRIHHIIPIAKCANIMGMGESTLRSWITSVRVQCSGSLINLCRKVHPNQLLASEVSAMKRLLTDEKFRLWPSLSLFYYARNNNIVTMARSTWYKYAGLLGIKRLKPLSVKHWGKSIVASKPNEYWHADVTQFRTRDGTLHYIYLVIDNFSRMILSHAVDTALSAAVRTQTFRDALNKALSLHPNIETINLLVYGGSENNNKTVDEFIASISNIRICKIRALKDVHFSTSMAEAANRILKTFYLNQRDIYNTGDLDRITEEAAYDINKVRPHGQLDGLIPIQAYTGITLDKARIDQQKAIARKNRTEINRRSSCLECKF